MNGTLLKGRYQIVRKLGSGSFGQTYLAADLDLPGHPPCVVKQLQPENPDWLQTAKRLFETEAQMLHCLGSHHQIPQLFAHFEENQQFYLVQDWIDGHPLSQELQPQRRWNEAQTIALLQDVLNILQFVHDNQVIHRDIKPDNLIRRATDQRLVLIDFGAVKQIANPAAHPSGRTIKTVAIGTPGYMPSEQSQGKPRCNSDLYALGVLAIQALTGIAPQHFQEDPDTGAIVWRRQAQVSPRLAAILDKMVQPYFRDRYQSAADVLHDLQTLPSPVSTPTSSSPAQPSSPVVSAAPPQHPVRKPTAASNPQPSVAPTQASPPPARSSSTVASSSPHRSTAAKPLLPSTVITVIAICLSGAIALVRLFALLQAPPATSPNSNSPTVDVTNSPVPEPPNAQAIEFFNQGEQFREMSQNEKALAAYDQAIAINPNYAEAQVSKCWILSYLKQFEAAVSACDRALELKPNYAEAWAIRGVALADLGQETEALANSDKAFQLSPNSGIVWLHRGRVLDRLKRYSAALAAFDKAIQLDPDSHFVWRGRGYALWQLRRYGEALAAYDKAIQLKPDDPYAWSGRGHALRELRRYDEALDAYDRSIQLKPDDIYVWNGRGNVLWDLNCYEEALEAYDKAIQLDPTYKVAIDNRTRLWERMR